jgi:hypothetical protein
MPLTFSSIELITSWCLQNETLAEIRAKARSDFFGYDEPGTIKYLGGAEELNARERRFLGWFGFYFKLPDARRPAELAAEALFRGSELTSALKSIQSARYVMAIVTTVIPGKTVYLELEKEEFEVTSHRLSQLVHKDDVICAHILPVGRNRWVLGPGWLTWPTRFGPGIRSHLKDFQLDPVQVERFLQMRDDGKEKPKVDIPRDKTLAEAVSRMTEAARATGKDQLIKSPEEWKKLVVAYMKADNFNQFTKDIVNWIGNNESLDEMNKWFGLATNIWNNTPQPDRGNKSATEIADEYQRRDKDII